MSIENEISSLTTAIRNLTDVLLASAAKSLPTPTVTEFPSSMSEFTNTLAPHVAAVAVTAPEPKKVGHLAHLGLSGLCAELAENAGVASPDTPAASAAPSNTASTSPEAPVPTLSEDDLRVQIVELAQPNMSNAVFKAFLGDKLAELQGARCSISGAGKLPKIDAAHLPTLLAAINKQLGK